MTDPHPHPYLRLPADPVGVLRETSHYKDLIGDRQRSFVYSILLEVLERLRPVSAHMSDADMAEQLAAAVLVGDNLLAYRGIDALGDWVIGRMRGPYRAVAPDIDDQDMVTIVRMIIDSLFAAHHIIPVFRSERPRIQGRPVPPLMAVTPSPDDAV